MKKLMIGVSTEQNTTNVMPALQMRVDRFLFLETSYAAKKEWSKGAETILQSRWIRIIKSLKLASEADSRIDIISEKLKSYAAKQSDTQIIWNIGGGQKAQQMALWQTFTDRSRAGLKDSACYANPASEQLEIWNYENSKLNYAQKPLNSRLSAEEILLIFGYQTQNTGTPLEIFRPKVNTKNLWSNNDFRRFFYMLPAITDEEQTKMIEKSEIPKFVKNHIKEIKKKQKQYLSEKLDAAGNSISKNAIIHNYTDEFLSKTQKYITSAFKENKPAPSFNDTEAEFNAACRKVGLTKPIKLSFDTFTRLTQTPGPAVYFEKLLFAIIRKRLPDKYISCMLNIDVYPQGSDKRVAEYDVLLADKSGKLTALDAKTFEFPGKDEDARMYNISQAGGKYVKFIPVLPYSPEDAIKPHYPEKLKALIKRLLEEGKEFYVMPGNTETSQTFDIEIGEHTYPLKSIINFLK